MGDKRVIPILLKTLKETQELSPRLEFTEVWSDEKVISTANVWEDWDISALVPSFVKAVLVTIHTATVVAIVVGARKDGSALDRKLALGENATFTLLVECSASRIIEIWGSATNGKFRISGYWS